MNYALMHKNTPVVELGIDEEVGVISKIGEIWNAPHLPVGLEMTNGVPNRRALNEWWTGRSIPANRSGLREALQKLNISSPRLLLTMCCGLSLSDQYWARPAGKPLEWKDVNFFGNTFSEDMGKSLFGASPGGCLNLMSPDNTTDGWLKKKWIVAGGQRCLIKCGSPILYQEPLNEALASAIMRRLNAPHASYGLIYEHGQPLSVCADFITPETDFIAAWRIRGVAKKPGHVSEHQHYLACCERLGIQGVSQSIDEMLTVDFLLANSDRHFNNFGVARNAETLEWIGAAPLFDCGASMYCNQPTQLICPMLPSESKPFRAYHDDQIKLATDFGWLDLAALRGIDEEYSEILRGSEYIDGARRTALCGAIKTRVELLRGVVSERSRKSSLPVRLNDAEREADAGQKDAPRRGNIGREDRCSE
jgi:hypothetical protein